MSFMKKWLVTLYTRNPVMSSMEGELGEWYTSKPVILAMKVDLCKIVLSDIHIKIRLWTKRGNIQKAFRGSDNQ